MHRIVENELIERVILLEERLNRRKDARTRKKLELSTAAHR